MPQILLPTGDQFNVGPWAVAPLWSKLDDHYPGAADRVTSPTNPTGSATFTVTLAAGVAPGSFKGWKVRARLSNSAASTVIDYLVELRTGGVTRASATFQHSSTTDTWYSFLLTEGEAATVNLAALQIRVTPTKVSGGNVMARVEALQLEIPDVGSIVDSLPGGVAQSKFRFFGEAHRMGLAQGAAVAGFQDSSGLANSLRTSIGSPTFKANAIQNYGAIVFDGVDDQMRMMWASAPERITIFAVMKLLALPQNGAQDFCIWSGESQTGKVMLGLTFGQGGLPGAEHVIEQAGIGDHHYFSCPTDGLYHLYRMRYDVLERCWIGGVEITDGTMPGDAGSLASIGMKLGSREDNARFWNGEVAALAVTTGLTDPEEVAIEDYFCNKFFRIGPAPATVAIRNALPTPTLVSAGGTVVTPGTITLRNTIPEPTDAEGVVFVTGSFPNGFTVPEGQIWQPIGVTTIGVAGNPANVVVNGTLRIRGSGDVNNPTTLRWLGIDEDTFVGGGLVVLESDPGLWVMGEGLLDIQGTPKTGWTRDPNSAVGWAPTDDMWITPTAPGADDAVPWDFGDPVPQAYPNVPPAEVFNMSRDILIEGQPDARAHIFIHTHETPHILKHFTVRYLGPRIPDTGQQGGSDVVLGRWPIHIHHAFDSSRGTIVEGVVARDCGSHVYVAHLSHGVTFYDCVSYQNISSPYWWDAREQTDDAVWLHCLAVETQISGDRGAFMESFHLNFGFRNRCEDCCSVATRGSGKTGGFVWNLNGGGPSPGPFENMAGAWDFFDNVSHNEKNGVSWWQNVRTGHETTRFIGYNHDDTGAGATIGAYHNAVFMTDSLLIGAPFDLHASGVAAEDGHAGTHYAGYLDPALRDGSQGMNGGRIEAEPFSVILTGSQLPAEIPSLFLEVEMTGGVDVTCNDRLRMFDFVRCLVDGDDLEFSDFVRSSGTNYTVRVQRRDGTAFSFTATTGPTVIPQFFAAASAGASPAGFSVRAALPTPTVVTVSTAVMPATIAVRAALPQPQAVGALKVTPATVALRAAVNQAGLGAGPQPGTVTVAVAHPTPGIVIAGGGAVQPVPIAGRILVRPVAIVIGGTGAAFALPEDFDVRAAFPTPSLLAAAVVTPPTVAMSIGHPIPGDNAGLAQPDTLALAVAVAEPGDIIWFEPVDGAGETVQIDPI